MSIDPTVTAEQPTAPLVAAVVTATDPELLFRCLDAIGDQVYEVDQVVVVGGDDEIRHVAGEFEAQWRPTLRSAVSSIGPDVTFVWALRERAIPEPQALRVLVQDSMRVNASVAGSKIVDADAPEQLVSVGYATDVFGAPYSGLQPGEIDQAQYDVIRDVGSVSGVSVLIRRDIYMGLGGIDRSMAPTAAAIDFCQRARLRGGRVVVIPRSVVRFDGAEQSSDWRERAGEIRAMIKSYSPLTLLWALPLTVLIGLAESVISIPFGRFPLPGVIAGWLWNIPRLPTAIRQRLQARRGREAGDEELFRYQVSGSARLRLLWDELMLRVRDRFPEGILSGFAEAVEAGQQRIRHPAFFVGALVVLFALVATREVWTEHLPVVGFSLPPGDSALDTLSSYAGGWNTAGLGSPEALRPAVGAVALVQLVAFGSGGLAIALITVASFLLGAFETGRLLRIWGIESAAGYLAGTTLMAGPAMVAATGATHWVAIPAMAAVPWAVRMALVGSSGGRSRLVSISATALATAAVAVFVPGGLIVPVFAVAAWVVLGVGEGRTRALAFSGGAALLALPLLVPWLLYLDPVEFLEAGTAAYWEPTWIVLAAFAVAGLGAALAGDRVVAAVGSWGAFLGVAGALIARTGGLGMGREVLVTGLLLSGFGVAVAVGAGLEAASRRREVGGWRSALSLGAGLAGAVLVAATLALAGPGRAGLPNDALTETFDFAVAQEGVSSRVLLFGDVADLPGTARTLDGLGYRVFIPPHPRAEEAFLNETFRLGDEALHATLEDLVSGRTRRGGDALAEFGIGWVAFVEPSPLEAVFESQLDLVALRSLDTPVFRNESAAAVAVSGEGVVWLHDGAGFVAPPGSAGGDVRIAANADFRWGPGDWAQDDWANQVSTQGGSLRFTAYSPRRLGAIAALIWLVALVVTQIVPRRRGGEA